MLVVGYLICCFVDFCEFLRKGDLINNFFLSLGLYIMNRSFFEELGFLIFFIVIKEVMRCELFIVFVG